MATSRRPSTTAQPARSSSEDENRSAVTTSVFPGFGELAADANELIADLVALRTERGLSQTDVTSRMGTSQSAVARLEGGHADTRLSTLERYASALGTSVRFAVVAARTERRCPDGHADPSGDFDDPDKHEGSAP